MKKQITYASAISIILAIAVGVGCSNRNSGKKNLASPPVNEAIQGSWLLMSFQEKDDTEATKADENGNYSRPTLVDLNGKGIKRKTVLKFDKEDKASRTQIFPDTNDHRVETLTYKIDKNTVVVEETESADDSKKSTSLDVKAISKDKLELLNLGDSKTITTYKKIDSDELEKLRTANKTKNHGVDISMKITKGSDTSSKSLSLRTNESMNVDCTMEDNKLQVRANDKYTDSTKFAEIVLKISSGALSEGKTIRNPQSVTRMPNQEPKYTEEDGKAWREHYKTEIAAGKDRITNPAQAKVTGTAAADVQAGTGAKVEEPSPASPAGAEKAASTETEAEAKVRKEKEAAAAAAAEAEIKAKKEKEAVAAAAAEAEIKAKKEKEAVAAAEAEAKAQKEKDTAAAELAKKEKGEDATDDLDVSKPEDKTTKTLSSDISVQTLRFNNKSQEGSAKSLTSEQLKNCKVSVTRKNNLEVEGTLNCKETKEKDSLEIEAKFSCPVIKRVKK